MSAETTSARRTRALLWLLAVGVAAFLILPLLIVLPVSFSSQPSFYFPPRGWSTRWYQNFVTDDQWRSSALNSLWIAFLAAGLATVAGALAAIGMRRVRRGYVLALMGAAVMVPMIVPEIVLSVGLYDVMLRLGLVGHTVAFVLSHAVLGLPFVVISVTVSLSGLDENLLDAASTLGARPATSWWTVAVPLIRPGLLSGFLLAYVTSLDNLVFSLFMKSPTMSTLPVQMFGAMTRDTDPTIAAASTVILGLTILIGIVAIVARKRMTRGIGGSADGSLAKGMGMTNGTA